MCACACQRLWLGAEPVRFVTIYSYCCRPATVAREIIPFDELDTYQLLLDVDRTQGAAGAIVPARVQLGSADEKAASNSSPRTMLALTDTQVDEIRTFLCGPAVDAGG